MGDLTPIAPKLGRLFPRLASDAEGEVVATARAISRTLTASGCDWHDLAERLARPVPQVRAAFKAPPPRPDAIPPRAMAEWLRAHAAHRLTANQRDFVSKAANLLALERTLTPKQSQWLRDLYAAHQGARA